MTRFIAVPADVAERHERKQRQDRLARARYETRNPDRKRAYRDRVRAQRPFIMWDGEGPQDAGYALFGNSAGYEICQPYLSTRACVELITKTAVEIPNAIHVAFGFNYDVSMILRELPWRHLRALHNFTSTVWNGYEIEHVPHKWFTVKYGAVACRIFDIRSFFAGGYLDALNDFGIGTEEERARIAHGKATREIFYWRDIEEIKEYWRTELKLGPELAGRMRDIFHDAGYVPSSWHGPGALARMALKRHKVYDAMAKCPYDVQLAAQYAFAGGRFELFKAGHVQGRVYNADIHSAYPHFARDLPNLNRGTWRRVRNYEPGKFGVYHIRYSARPDNTRAFPLFRRMPDGCVVWPNRVVGWYWSPEADTVKDDPNASFIEGWVFDEDDPTDRPFAWLADYYDRRRRLKANGSAAQYTFKLIINAIYGQLAQRTGWDRKHNRPPKSHQLEWAGYITSACRAAVYRVAASCGDKLISIDTDGVASLAPFDNIRIGEALGEWELSEYVDGIYWQSGIYCLKTDDKWTKNQTRGIKKGSYTADDLLNALYRTSCEVADCQEIERHIHLNRRVFVTYGLADMGQHELHNTWQDEPHVYVMGGGKRVHSELACPTACHGSLHTLFQWSPTYGADADDPGESRRHYLPWLGETDEQRQLMEEFMLYDADHLSDDELWVLEYA